MGVCVAVDVGEGVNVGRGVGVSVGLGVKGGVLVGIGVSVGTTTAAMGVFGGAGVYDTTVEGVLVYGGAEVLVGGIGVSVGGGAEAITAGGWGSDANRGHINPSSKALMPLNVRSTSTTAAHKPAVTPSSLSHKGLELPGPPQKMTTAIPISIRHKGRLSPPAPGAGTLPPIPGGEGGAGGMVFDGGVDADWPGGGWALGGTESRDPQYCGYDSMRKLALRSHHVHDGLPEAGDCPPKYQWLGFWAH